MQEGAILEAIFRETQKEFCWNKCQTVGFRAHVHDDIEMVYVKKGGGVAFCDGKKYALTDNSCFLVFPNQVHQYLDFDNGEYLILIMKPFELLRYNEIFMKGVPENALCSFDNQNDSGLVTLMEMAQEEYEREGFSDVIAAYLTAIFGKLLPFYNIKKANYSRDNALRVLEFCTTHCKEDLSVETVAQHLSISKSCVSHIFSNRISMNFCDYINSLRLKEAEEILRNKNYSITEVASLSGFATIRTFNRAFLKKHGVSPTSYRKALKE